MKRYAVLLLATVFVSAQSPPEVEITAEPHHHLVLANDQVRVFSVEVAPHAETLMHWHRHDYIYVTLGQTEVVNAVKGKDPVSVKLQEGETRFVSTGFAHIARNVADQPFRNVTIEILRDDKLRQSPFHWDEDRGLEILQGGTKEILFVKDGVRVSEVELQPKGTLPLSAGPQLLVALSNLHLFQGTPHRNLPVHAMHIIRKAGEVQWLPASHLKELECMGQPAKFVTLEFPQK
jgi:quercetin dioxygenase-like cupin family protein